MNTGLKLSGGKEKRVAQWLESAYFWIALFVALTAPRRPTRALARGVRHRGAHGGASRRQPSQYHGHPPRLLDPDRA